MSPSSLWPAVKSIREAFPNGTGFYVPTNDTADTVTVLGERFKHAPAAAAPHYWYQMNESRSPQSAGGRVRGQDPFGLHDLRHPRAPVRRRQGRRARRRAAAHRRSRHQPEHRRLPAGAGPGSHRRRRRRVPGLGRARAARYRDLQGPADLLRAGRVLPPDGRRRPCGHGAAEPRRGQQPANQVRLDRGRLAVRARRPGRDPPAPARAHRRRADGASGRAAPRLGGQALGASWRGCRRFRRRWARPSRSRAKSA